MASTGSMLGRKERSAVLICDFQRGTLPFWTNDPEWREATLANLEGLVVAVWASSAYRDGDLLLGFVGIAFGAGYPEVGPTAHPIFQQFKQEGLFLADAPDSVGFHPVAPQLATSAPLREFVVHKTRGSAFFGTNLDVILRSHDVSRIVLAGLATSGVVLSTVRYAFDADYQIVVLEDCCGDLSRDKHDALVQHIFSPQATVTTWRTWAKDL